MTKLFFDTETTGFVKTNSPWTDPGQPKLVQIALVQTSDNLEVEQSVCITVKPNGWEIPEKAAEIHGITHEIATEVGLPLKLAIDAAGAMIAKADEVIGHNVKFDTNILRCQFAYMAMPMVEPASLFCTMEESKDIVKCPPTEKMLAAGRTQYKNPKLEEAYKHFTGTDMQNAHDAMADVQATIAVYRGIKGA